MKMINETQCTIERAADPAAFFAAHASELAEVGGSAFAQPAETFAPQVQERFGVAEIAQIMKYGQQIVGFALYDVLRSSHWRLAIY